MVRIRPCTCEKDNCSYLNIIFKFSDNPESKFGPDYVFGIKNGGLAKLLKTHGDLITEDD